MTYYIICTNNPNSKQPICMMGTYTDHELAECICDTHNKWYKHIASPARCQIITDIDDE